MRIVACLACLALAVGCNGNGDANGSGKKFARQLCVEKFKPIQESLKKSVDKKDFGKISQNFLRIQRHALEMLMERVPRYEQDNLTSFKEHAKRLHVVAFDGFKLAEKKDIAGVKKSQANVKKRCLSCHEEYKSPFQE